MNKTQFNALMSYSTKFNLLKLLTLICAYHNKRECLCFLTLISFAYCILHIYLQCE